MDKCIPDCKGIAGDVENMSVAELKDACELFTNNVISVVLSNTKV